MEIFVFKGNRAYRWSDDQETPEICGRSCLSQSVKGKREALFLFEKDRVSFYILTKSDCEQ